MAQYNYKAVNTQGEILEGEMEGRTQAAVIERLKSMG